MRTSPGERRGCRRAAGRGFARRRRANSAGHGEGVAGRGRSLPPMRSIRRRVVHRCHRDRHRRMSNGSPGRGRRAARRGSRRLAGPPPAVRPLTTDAEPRNDPISMAATQKRSWCSCIRRGRHANARSCNLHLRGFREKGGSCFISLRKPCSFMRLVLTFEGCYRWCVHYGRRCGGIALLNGTGLGRCDR